MKSVLLSVFLFGALAACSVQPPQAPSESQSSPSTMNTAQRTEICEVMSVRTVRLTQPYTGGQTRSRVGQNPGPQERNGQLLGAVAGVLLGNAIDDKNGAAIGGLIGSVGGSYVGAQRDAQAPYAFGQEVIVRMTNSRNRSNLRTVTQGNSPDARPLYVGQRCALVGTGNNVRVIAM